MKGETGTFPSEDPRPVGLLEIQSEELARKLQVEAEAISGGDESGLDHGGSPATVEIAVRSVIAQPMTSQGAWGTPGRSGADLLRSPSSADPQRLQPPSHSHDRTGAPAKLPTVATADATALPGVPLSAGAVGALVAMGIEESWAAAALRRCGGLDVARAVEFCFSHDMDALAQEDAAAYASTAQPGVDGDGDMAFAVALEQEERRAFEARRVAAAMARAEEEGTFGPKVRVAAVTAAAPHPRNDGFSSLETQSLKRPERWGLAEADALVDGGDVDTSPRGEGAEVGRTVGENEDEDENDSEGDAGGGLRSIPEGGRRKGKMPLFRNAAGEVVSKHDAIICGRMNAREASTFEGVGDLPAAGVRLDNRTFNSLKRNILKKKQEKGIAAGERVEGATRSTQEGVMDPRTRLLVFKMINAGVLLEVHGIVKTGKEAHVYHALAPEDPNDTARLAGVRGVALKIFRTTLSEFGNRAAYIDGDPRYPNIRFNKQSRNKMFSIWAKKEHRNLIRLHRSGLPCPEPILQREHTIIMSFVGEEHWPAPQLREVELSGSKWRRCYLQVLELIRLMFLKCRLVHSDLSEYNLLYHRKMCYVIDVGQAVDTGHPKSREFLARDLSVVTDFFRRKGVSRCLDPSLAEAFVVSYRGPSDGLEAGEEGGLAGPAGRTSRGGGDRGREPPTGGEVIAELMGTEVDEAHKALRSACEAAEPWADGVYGEDDDIEDNIRDDIDDDIVEEEGMDDDIRDGAGDELEELEGGGEGQEGEVVERSSGPGSEAPIERNDGEGRKGVIEPGARAKVEVQQGKGVEEGSGGSSGERGAAKRVGDGARKAKVEIGDRERARMADLKEALKAGIL